MKAYVWFPCLLGLWALCTSSAWGGRDAFEVADYRHCVYPSQLPAPEDMRVALKLEEGCGAVQVSWKPLPDPESLPGKFTTQITAILESRGMKPRVRHAPLGGTSLEFRNLHPGQKGTITLAVTDGENVLSRLATATFGAPAARPQVSAPFFYRSEEDLHQTAGVLYYIGFGANFANGYVMTGNTQPEAARLRVGVRHGAGYDPAEVDFARFRLRLEDSSGQDMLGYTAGTMPAGALYGDRVLVLGTATALDIADPGAAAWTTLPHSGRLASPAPSAWETATTAPYWSVADAPVIAREPEGANVAPLTFTNLAAVTQGRALFAPVPDAIQEFPSDTLVSDRTYRLQVWAEDESGRQISPACELSLWVETVVAADSLYTNVWGYDEALGSNRHDAAAVHGGPGRVLVFRLLEEDCEESVAACQGSSPPAGSPRPPTEFPVPQAVPPFSLLPASISTVGAGYNLSYWVKADNKLGHDVDIVGRKISISRTSDVTDTAKRLPPDILAGAYLGVDVGEAHACAIKNTDSTVTCWGDIRADERVPDDLGAVAGFSVGGYHACAVMEADSTVRCWGWNKYQQAQPPSGVFHSVASGRAHTCGLRQDGQVQCWGFNDYGAGSVPSHLSRPQAARSIAAGHHHNCVIRPNDTVSCWGRNQQGQTNVPPGLGPVRALSAGQYHTCAIRSTGAIACWGDDRYGQISQVPSGTDWAEIHVGFVHTCGRRANGSVTCWRIRETTSPAMKSVSSGIQQSCGIRKADDYIQCWGSLNEIAQGRKTVDGRGVYPEEFKAISVIEGSMCGIKKDETVDCWGVSSYGSVTVPDDLGTVKAVSSFNKNACAIKSDDTVVCWGTYQNNNANTVPSALGAVKALDTGNVHTCAIKSDDNLQCWGTIPKGPPDDLGTVKAVSLSGDRTCVIKSDDTVQCWGTYTTGGPPSDLGTVKALAVYDGSSSHSCAIKTDDTVVCWDGTSNAQKNPIDSTLEVSAISVGTHHGCAIKESDSTIVCWGEPTDGAADGPKVDS